MKFDSAAARGDRGDGAIAASRSLPGGLVIGATENLVWVPPPARRHRAVPLRLAMSQQHRREAGRAGRLLTHARDLGAERLLDLARSPRDHQTSDRCSRLMCTTTTVRRDRRRRRVPGERAWRCRSTRCMTSDLGARHIANPVEGRRRVDHRGAFLGASRRLSLGPLDIDASRTARAPVRRQGASAGLGFAARAAQRGPAARARFPTRNPRRRAATVLGSVPRFWGCLRYAHARAALSQLRLSTACAPHGGDRTRRRGTEPFDRHQAAYRPRKPKNLTCSWRRHGDSEVTLVKTTARAPPGGTLTWRRCRSQLVTT